MNEKYVLTDHLWRYLQDYADKHRAKGSGGFGLVGPEDVTRTLSARYYKDGSEIPGGPGQGTKPAPPHAPRCARLMGFEAGESRMVIAVSDTQAYKQFGNAVVVPVVEAVARHMAPWIGAGEMVGNQHLQRGFRSVADVVDTATRSRMMANIRGKDTAPEMLIRRGLHSRGFRFRLHSVTLPGKPDLVFPRRRAVVFVHGASGTGGCHLFKWPRSRVEFWREKIFRNVSRDQAAVEAVSSAGWRVLTIWECALKARTAAACRRSGRRGRVVVVWRDTGDDTGEARPWRRLI
ncbi:MAG: DNA mismatch endonuclease Vsr [Hyphomicrobiales bacterium]